jgi:hypothetical protein
MERMAPTANVALRNFLLPESFGCCGLEAGAGDEVGGLGGTVAVLGGGEAV